MIESLKDAIYRIVEADQPMTVRQTFYRLVAIGAVDKSEGEYKQTVCRLLTEMRPRASCPTIGSPTTPAGCASRAPSIRSRTR